MLAYDYPLLGVFWTMFVLFIWIAWIFILVKVLSDVFRSDDMGGGIKALWVIFIIFLPFLGTFVYLIARGKGMGERDVAIYEKQQEAFHSLREGRRRIWDERGRRAGQAGRAQGPRRDHRGRVRGPEGQGARLPCGP